MKPRGSASPNTPVHYRFQLQPETEESPATSTRSNLYKNSPAASTFSLPLFAPENWRSIFTTSSRTDYTREDTASTVSCRTLLREESVADSAKELSCDGEKSVVDQESATLSYANRLRKSKLPVGKRPDAHLADVSRKKSSLAGNARLKFGLLASPQRQRKQPVKLPEPAPLPCREPDTVCEPEPVIRDSHDNLDNSYGHASLDNSYS